MNKKKKVMELISFSDVLDEPEFAEFVFDIICEEINDSQEKQPNGEHASERYAVNSQKSTHGHSVYTTRTVSSFEDTKEKFERVVNLFNKETSEKKNFIANFHSLRPVFKTNNELLKILFRAKRNKDCDYDETTTTFPAMTDGKYQHYPNETHCIGTAVFSAALSYIAARKDAKMEEKLQQAKTLIREELDAFSAVCHWFTYLDEVKNSIDALIDYDVLKEMFRDLMEFFSSYKTQMNLEDCEFKNRLKDMLKSFVRKMKIEGKLKFGNEITPVVITFVFVFCLWQGQNRMMLECVMKSQILNLCHMPVLNSNASEWEQVSEDAILVSKQEICNQKTGNDAVACPPLSKAVSEISKPASVYVFPQLGIQERGNDAVACPPLSKAVSKTSKPASVYNVFPQLGIQERGNEAVACPPLSETANQTANLAFAPESPPEDIDIGIDALAFQRSSTAANHAFKSASEQELERFLNLGNAINLLTLKVVSLKKFKNPGVYLASKISRAAEDFENAFSTIETFYNVAKHYQPIPDTRVIPMIAVLIMSIPDDARQEDIKMAVKPFLPEEAWDGIKLQRMLTNGNNWMVQLKPRHSQLLMRQTSIVIKEKSCAVIH